MIVQFIHLLVLFAITTFSAVIPKQSFLTPEELTHLEGDPEVTHKVTFTISQEQPNKEPPIVLGDITIGLFGSVVPKTVENFYQLSSHKHDYGYLNSPFHRIIKDFMMQGGDFARGTGTGGFSIYDESTFPDENFELKHDKLGRVSMANAGKDTNGSQFFILNKDSTPHLDGKHVVFGQVIGGIDVVLAIAEVKTTRSSRPLEKIYISGIKTEIRETEDESKKEALKLAEDAKEQQQTEDEAAALEKSKEEVEEKQHKEEQEENKAAEEALSESAEEAKHLTEDDNNIVGKTAYEGDSSSFLSEYKYLLIFSVRNLPYNTSTESLYEFFGKYGNINQIRIPDPRANSSSSSSAQQGTCFIIYNNTTNAIRAAHDLNGVNFNGRYLVTSLYHVDRSKIANEELTLRQEHLNELKKMYEISD
ncbi:uncharacterized protein J8A68_000251 [[Candida] subhashii]|uniref:peptidylprolyl isomerase n=1 Tax=[Candida] subhashii TaxID=561895 RepID=A0A8J5QTE4_9ASCO|nr:uncharacterized protein J8A68_000251 [[Candida] subhashii]KAG7666206.1 hypothetical protein J8A68_000251 [[Candida] subhashii]